MSWSPVPRYRHVPITLLTLTCGHTRFIWGGEDFTGEYDLPAQCHGHGCDGLQYVLTTRVFGP